MNRGILAMLFLLAIPSTSGAGPLPKDTQLTLPAALNNDASWVLLPNSSGESRAESQPFAIDRDGQPWFGIDPRTLFNPVAPALFEVDQPIQSFLSLESGGFLVVSDDLLGSLTSETEGNKLDFRPELKLPARGCRLFPGAQGALYLVENGPAAGGMLYLLQPSEARGQPFRARALLKTAEPIAAAAGDGRQTYVAIEGAVFRLADGKMVPVLLAEGQKVRDLAYSPDAGLFYATDSMVGFAGKAKPINFLKTPHARIRAQGGSLFILLTGSQGLIKIGAIRAFQEI